ncbi:MULTISPECIES: response regulator transcription factor [unclassified Cupriavidus]|uniref:response regulator transcription factor n=1 Tax=unclassified Cupriavidus TaxID=2640874 RepID=UPI00048C5731|nr:MULTISPECIES: response regulator transcription factor [unclassified Cupriavidus]MBP0630775.1 response regulator transcription factor [Cupriavidus sp. AcVe19-1a]MBP0637437.1 response regulator transcription factor [Cupriavidus sp. AcVe19-6a]
MPDNSQAKIVTVYLLERANAIRSRQLGILARLPRIEVAGSGASALTELTRLMHHRPEVVMIGLRTASGGAIQEIRILRSALPDAIVIVLGDALSLPLRRACIRAGASYCFDRTLELDALRVALSGLRTARAP